MERNKTKEVPSDYIGMMDIVLITLKKYGTLAHEQLACEISDALRRTGYARQDPYALAFVDQLRHGLTGLKENLSKIREGISFIELTEEKCGRILRLLEHQRKRGNA